MIKSSARYEHQLKTTAINLQLAATTEVLAWILQAVGPTIRPALFDPLKRGHHAHITIIDVVAYLKLNHSNLSSQDIFSLNAIILYSYNSEISKPASFVKWGTVYTIYTSYGIATADAIRLAHFSTAVNTHGI